MQKPTFAQSVFNTLNRWADKLGLPQGSIARDIPKIITGAIAAPFMLMEGVKMAGAGRVILDLFSGDLAVGLGVALLATGTTVGFFAAQVTVEAIKRSGIIPAIKQAWQDIKTGRFLDKDPVLVAALGHGHLPAVQGASNALANARSDFNNGPTATPSPKAAGLSEKTQPGPKTQ